MNYYTDEPYSEAEDIAIQMAKIRKENPNDERLADLEMDLEDARFF